MSDKSLKVLCSQAIIVTIEVGVFSAVPVPQGGLYLVEYNTGKFRATSDDGRVSGDFFKVAEHLADSLNHLRTGWGSFFALSH
jgi:hypothetical protein